jgi:PTS system nitrogen regulatory IIA component
MNLLASLLPLSNVELDIDARDKGAALERAAQLFENNQGLSGSGIVECLTAREQLGSTGLGKGVAIPHGRLRGLKRAAAAIIRVKEPIEFDSPDGQPVWLLVVLLVPEHATQQHLEILSELAQMLSEPSMRGQLQTIAQPAALLATVAAWEPIRPAA